MTPARVLVTNMMMLKERDRFDEELRARGYDPVWVDVEQFLTEERCLSLVGDIDGWLAGDDQITRAVLEKSLPRLKVIAKWGTGIDSIDTASASELGVPVLNAPGAFADAVAEVAIGLILMVTRRLGHIDRDIRAGRWPKPQGLELKGATLGMIGFGAIGRRIGQLGAAFGMTVRFADPIVDGAEPVETVAEAADVLCLACGLTPENHHLVNADLIKRMKPGAVVANVARGPLVETQALVDALQAGHLGGAALDVYEEEPLPAGHALLGFDNVVVSSHNANNGQGAVETVHARTLANLDSVLR